MKKLVISVVSYLNSIPFKYALLNKAQENNWDVQLDIPSACADKLIAGKADIGLIPVAEIKNVSNAVIIGEYGIAADGDVQSVLLLSNVPLNEIKTILLDYHSRTSVRLCKILAQNFWKINTEWKNASEGFESEIKNNTAAVVIGDRALLLRNKYKYVYDLSGEWKKFTGLPFVFACWVANKEIDKQRLQLFEEALKTGVNNRQIVLDSEKITDNDKRDYILNIIKYKIEADHKEAIEKFRALSNKLR